MRFPSHLLLPVLILVTLAACHDRDARDGTDAGPIEVDSGADVEAGVDGGPVVDGGGDSGLPDAGEPDAGPAMGSCLGACSAAGAAMCASFSSETCRSDCTTARDESDAAGCGTEYRIVLGCLQMAVYTCNASGEPETEDCETESTAWADCMGT